MKLKIFGIVVEVKMSSTVKAEDAARNEMLKKVYGAFGNLLNLMDNWGKDVSALDCQSKEKLAIAWLYIVEFAQETNTLSVLKSERDQEEAETFSLGTFSRAQLVHEEANWSKTSSNCPVYID